MMREAQKMMQDPAFQEYMKKMTESREFQASIQKTQVRRPTYFVGCTHSFDHMTLMCLLHEKRSKS